ncbi:MAG: DUF58 domain-containing protein, partial [Gammaproteobacteria bacterium]
MIAALQRRAQAWRTRSYPADRGELAVARRRVYILPTKAGLGFGALLLILLIGSINYSLGLGYALTFTLGACGVVDIWFTYRNLVQLRLRGARALPVFAGEAAQFELQLANPTSRARYALAIEFMHPASASQLADVAPDASTTVTLSAPTGERGRMAAPRVRLHTRFPLGLFRAWTYWQPDLQVLVYPFPEPVAPPLPASGVSLDDGQGQAGSEDFAGIRSYQPGDALRHLAWRQIARLDPADGGQLVTKHFEGGALDELVLDFDALPTFMNLELRLSHMTRWVLEAEQHALPYGFRMAGRSIEPSFGP